MLSAKFKSWKLGFDQRVMYSTMERRRYYDIASQYLPAEPNAVVVDLGSGDGSFADHLNLRERYRDVFLLDGNPDTARELASRYPHALHYRAPERLPFDGGAVSFIHSSHMVEHLQPDELLALLREIDRVLTPRGIVVISTPMLWAGFYSDLSHVRPYNPGVFTHYLCQPGRNRSAESVSTDYAVLDLVFRYLSQRDLNDGWGSRHGILDFLIQIPKRMLHEIGIHPYQKTGYTLVLRKGDGGASQTQLGFPAGA